MSSDPRFELILEFANSSGSGAKDPSKSGLNDNALSEFAEDVRRGLCTNPKSLPCRWLYDAKGSELFEQICGLEEYYVTRAEDEILRREAAHVAAALGDTSACFEFGSGSAVKTRLLLEAMLTRHPSVVYAAVDISQTALERSGRALVKDYERLRFIGLVGEYRRGMQWLGENQSTAKVVLFLGSNIGNFNRSAAVEFLQSIRAGLSPCDTLLLGIDLRKQREVLESAYDDANGVTARFNLNLLHRINRELGGRFDVEQFEHEAVWDEDEGVVRMNLRSRRDQTVEIAALHTTLTLQKDERIHTEDSYKYSAGEIDRLASSSGFEVSQWWTDSARRFRLNLLSPAEPRSPPKASS